MYLQSILSKIQVKHGSETEAYVKFYSLPESLSWMTTGKQLRLDKAVAVLARAYYEKYCLNEGTDSPLEERTFRLSEPMSSPAGLCTMYRIYQERFDGFHQVGLVTVFNGVEYPDYKWREEEIKRDTWKPKYPWWLSKYQ